FFKRISFLIPLSLHVSDFIPTHRIRMPKMRPLQCLSQFTKKRFNIDPNITTPSFPNLTNRQPLTYPSKSRIYICPASWCAYWSTRLYIEDTNETQGDPD